MVLRCRCGGSVIHADAEAVCVKCGMVQAQEVHIVESKSILGLGGWRIRDMGSMISLPTARARRDIEAICSKCGAPDVVYRRALSIYNSALGYGLQRGCHHATFAAAIVSLACRMEMVPRTTKSICEAALVKPCSMHRAYNTIAIGLSLDIPPPDPASFISGMGSACDLPVPVLRQAAELLRRVQPQMSGKDPATLAAAALYIVCVSQKNGVTQQQIADAASVSTVSMRLRRQDIERALD